MENKQTFKLDTKQFNIIKHNFSDFIGYGMEVNPIGYKTYMLIVKWDKLESYDNEWNQNHNRANMLKYTLFGKLNLKSI